MNFLSKIIQKSFLVFCNYSFIFFKSTLLILILFFFGFPDLSADIAIVSSFVLMICSIVSYNERAIINSDKNTQYLSSVFFFRLISSVIIFIISFFFLLGANLLSFFSITFATVILSNWMLEIFVNSCETEKKKKNLYICLFYNVLYIFIFIYLIKSNQQDLFAVLNFFSSLIIVVYIFLFFLEKKFEEDILYKYFKYIFGNFKNNTSFSSLFISSSNFFFRYFIIMLSPSKSFAGSLFTLFAVCSLPGTIYNSILVPSLLRNFKRFGNQTNLYLFTVFIYSIFIFVIFLFFKNDYEIFKRISFYEIFFISISSLIITDGLKKRFLLLKDTNTRDICFQLDVLNSLFIICLIPIIYLAFDDRILYLSFFFTSIFTNFTYSFKNFDISNNFKFVLIILTLIPLFFVINENGTVELLNNKIITLDILDDFLVIHLGTFLMPLIFFYILQKRVINKTVFWIIILNIFFALLSITIFRQNLKFLNFYNLMMFIFPILSFLVGYSLLVHLKNKQKLALIVFLFSGFIIVLQIFYCFFDNRIILNDTYFGLSIYKNLQYSSQAFSILFFTSCIILYFRSSLNLQLLLASNAIILIYLFLANSISGIFIFLNCTIFLYSFILKNKSSKFFNFGFIITLIIFLLFLLLLVITYYSNNNTELNPNAQTISEKIQNLSPYLNFKLNELVNELNFLNKYNNIFFGVEPSSFKKISDLKSSLYFVDYFLHLGMITFIPLLILILKTLSYFIAGIKDKNSPEITLLFIIIFQYLIFDTFFKSSLREPYISNIIFMLWGYVYFKLEDNFNEKLKT
jgi:hypothetical protein